MALMSFYLGLAALALLAVLHVHASPAIIVPSNITADERREFNISQRIDADDSDTRERFDAYRVYLSLEPPGWGAGPVCWLSYAEDLDTKQVNITIPADVAPDETQIRISTSLYKKGQSHVNGYSYSIHARLLGANGTWSQRELDGRTISDENKVSCWAFGCVRRCNERYYTGDKTRYNDETSEEKKEACADQCVKDLNPRGSPGSGSANLRPMPSILIASVAVGIVLRIL
ncbi:hypothetical protein FZEAL_3878 [Fusarium zealandicum]|uniref:Uncharacterized protein n=1 Tax=Fusarium zealandicum TaxID=1053134 RepID=A0A8H4XLD2_9HYPO|nr:hypothetical protein FZEAL_3878 [Fusarium zealandicum]